MSELEIAQEKFYRATGFLAPGKDEPAAMCGQMDFNREEVRRMLWSAWRVKDTEIAALESERAKIRGLEIDRDKWKWEYANLVEFANDYEKRAEQAEARVGRLAEKLSIIAQGLAAYEHASSGDDRRWSYQTAMEGIAENPDALVWLSQVKEQARREAFLEAVKIAMEAGISGGSEEWSRGVATAKACLAGLFSARATPSEGSGKGGA